MGLDVISHAAAGKTGNPAGDDTRINGAPRGCHVVRIDERDIDDDQGPCRDAMAGLRCIAPVGKTLATWPLSPASICRRRGDKSASPFPTA
jgi:hypothetical protein